MIHSQKNTKLSDIAIMQRDSQHMCQVWL